MRETPGRPRREGPRYDQALKRLLTQAHDGFLALIAPGLIWQGERSPELPAVARQADLVWEVSTADGDRGLLHVELQTEPDEELGERLAEYKLRLRRRDHLDIHSVVVFLRPTERIPASPFLIPWRKNAEFHSDFEVVRLWELPPERVLATAYYGLWPLASLMAGASVERAVEIGEKNAAAPIPQEERGELAGLLAVLAELRLGRQQMLDMLRRNPMLDELVRQSVVYERALAEGEARGEAQGMRDMVRIVLEGRFGPLGEEVLAALAGADESALQLLGARAATGTLEEIRAHLGLA